MKAKRITILLGHPDKTAHCGDFARAYEKGANDAGHETKLIYAGDLKFDPILHRGYSEIQPLEPDLIKVQEAIKWCSHFVIIYPSWFIMMPAILKGLFDRIWLPGFAYHFKQNGYRWEKLLKGRSARVVITFGGSPFMERIFLGDYTNEIHNGILALAGFSPVRISKIGNMNKVSDRHLAKIKEKMTRLGKWAY